MRAVVPENVSGEDKVGGIRQDEIMSAQRWYSVPDL